MFPIITIPVLLFLAFVLFHELRSKIQNLPPGPFRWPLVGSLLKFRKVKYPHRTMVELSKKYGNVMSFGFGSKLMVVISSFDLLKQVFSRKDLQESRFQFPFVKDRAYGNPDTGIMFRVGENWQFTRRYIVTTLKQFGFGKKNSMTLVMQEEMADLVSTITEQTVNGVWEVNDTILGCSAVNILWSLLAGYRFQRGDKKLLRAVSLNEKIAVIIGLKNRYAILPWIKDLFPVWSGHLEHMQTFKEMKEFLTGVIDDVKARRNERQTEEAENFIEAFLEEIEQRGETDNFNEQNLVMILQDMFTAGSETTGHTFNWLLLYISLFPDVQRKLHEEIVRVIGPIGTTPPSLEHDIHMPYTKSIICETMRLANVIPIAGFRVASEKFEVEGYTIPKGTLVTANIESVLRDEHLWGDPDVFRPERFLKPKSGSGLEYELVNTEKVAVFGFGRRECIGETLAWNSLFLFLTTLVQTFEFTTIPGMEPSTDPSRRSGTLSPRKYSLRVVTRQF